MLIKHVSTPHRLVFIVPMYCSGAVSKPDLMDRLLARLDSYRQGEFLDGANDHASTEYLRVLGLLARNSDVSPL